MVALLVGIIQSLNKSIFKIYRVSQMAKKKAAAKCKCCGEKFKTKAALKRHMKDCK